MKQLNPLRRYGYWIASDGLPIEQIFLFAWDRMNGNQRYVFMDTERVNPDVFYEFYD